MAVFRIIPTVAKLQKIIDYKFKNTQLLWEALQAPGSITPSGETVHALKTRHSLGFERLPDGNKRLAVVGDAALKLALCEDWYLGDEVRERLSRIVSDVGSNDNLDRVGRGTGLENLINDNPSMVAKGEGVSPLTMAGTVEAIIGAVYIDGGMKPVPGVLQNLGLTPKYVRKTILKREKEPAKKPSNGAEISPK